MGPVQDTCHPRHKESTGLPIARPAIFMVLGMPQFGADRQDDGILTGLGHVVAGYLALTIRLSLRKAVSPTKA